MIGTEIFCNLSGKRIIDYAKHSLIYLIKVNAVLVKLGIYAIVVSAEFY